MVVVTLATGAADYFWLSAQSLIVIHWSAHHYLHHNVFLPRVAPSCWASPPVALLPPARQRPDVLFMRSTISTSTGTFVTASSTPNVDGSWRAVKFERAYCQFRSAIRRASHFSADCGRRQWRHCAGTHGRTQRPTAFTCRDGFARKDIASTAWEDFSGNDPVSWDHYENGNPTCRKRGAEKRAAVCERGEHG
jgi:hypothetical protein